MQYVFQPKQNRKLSLERVTFDENESLLVDSPHILMLVLGEICGKETRSAPTEARYALQRDASLEIVPCLLLGHKHVCNSNLLFNELIKPIYPK